MAEVSYRIMSLLLQPMCSCPTLPSWYVHASNSIIVTSCIVPDNNWNCCDGLLLLLLLLTYYLVIDVGSCSLFFRQAPRRFTPTNYGIQGVPNVDNVWPGHRDPCPDS